MGALGVDFETCDAMIKIYRKTPRGGTAHRRRTTARSELAIAVAAPAAAAAVTATVAAATITTATATAAAVATTAAVPTTPAAITAAATSVAAAAAAATPAKAAAAVVAAPRLHELGELRGDLCGVAHARRDTADHKRSAHREKERVTMPA